MPTKIIFGLLPFISALQTPAIVRKKTHQLSINSPLLPTRACPSTRFSPPIPCPPHRLSPNKWSNSLLNLSRLIDKEKYYMNLRGTSFPHASRKLSKEISSGSWRYLWRWEIRNYKKLTINNFSRHSVALNAS